MGLRGPTGPMLGIPKGSAGGREGRVQEPKPLHGDEIREAYYTSQQPVHDTPYNTSPPAYIAPQRTPFHTSTATALQPLVQLRPSNP